MRFSVILVVFRFGFMSYNEENQYLYENLYYFVHYREMSVKVCSTTSTHIHKHIKYNR